jgi:hypothetical protein
VHLRDLGADSLVNAATALGLGPRLGIAAAAILIAPLAAWFGRQQNRRAAIGGAISGPKITWLAYAIMLWFFVSPAVACDGGVHRHLRALLALFSVLMWLRGGVELLMMYRWKNWRPPYGITHDLLCLVVLVAGGIWARAAVGGEASPLDRRVLGLVALLTASLIVEVMYAALFFHAVAGRTTGEDGVWFASQEEARFRRINRITAALNLPLYAGLLGFVWSVWP